MRPMLKVEDLTFESVRVIRVVLRSLDGIPKQTLHVPYVFLQSASYFKSRLSGRWRDAEEAVVEITDTVTDQGAVDVILCLINGEESVALAEALAAPSDVTRERLLEFMSAAAFLGFELPPAFIAVQTLFLRGVLHHWSLTVQPMEDPKLRVVSSRCFASASPSICAPDAFVAVRLSEDFALGFEVIVRLTGEWALNDKLMLGGLTRGCDVTKPLTFKADGGLDAAQPVSGVLLSPRSKGGSTRVFEGISTRWKSSEADLLPLRNAGSWWACRLTPQGVVSVGYRSSADEPVASALLLQPRARLRLYSKLGQLTWRDVFELGPRTSPVAPALLLQPRARTESGSDRDAAVIVEQIMLL